MNWYEPLVQPTGELRTERLAGCITRLLFLTMVTYNIITVLSSYINIATTNRTAAGPDSTTSKRKNKENKKEKEEKTKPTTEARRKWW